MTRLPPSIACLIPNGDQVVVEDLTLDDVRGIIASTSTALERGRQLAASTLPINWREHADMKALVEWLGGVAELERLKDEPPPPYTGDFDPGEAVRDSALAAQRDAAIRERDAARAFLACEVTGHKGTLARAEAAEAKLAKAHDEIDAWKTATGLCCPAEEDGGDPSGVTPSMLEAHLAERDKRAAALAAALLEILNHDGYTMAGLPVSESMKLIARAALAGNGNGTGA